MLFLILGPRYRNLIGCVQAESIEEAARKLGCSTSIGGIIVVPKDIMPYDGHGYDELELVPVREIREIVSKNDLASIIKVF